MVFRWSGINFMTESKDSMYSTFPHQVFDARTSLTPENEGKLSASDVFVFFSTEVALN